MKRFSYLLLASMIILAVGLYGCGSTNQFGGSFDISKICADSGCVGTADNEEVSIFANQPLTVYFELQNLMEAIEGSTGQTVRTKRVEISYTTPNGQAIPMRVEELVVNVLPDAKVIVPVTIFSYEQMEYIRDRLVQFPDLPFQAGCGITVFYDTTGGQSGSVERLLSIQVTY